MGMFSRLIEKFRVDYSLQGLFDGEDPDDMVHPERTLAGFLAAAPAAVILFDNPIVTAGPSSGSLQVTGVALAEVMPGDGSPVQFLVADELSLSLTAGPYAEQLVAASAASVRVETARGRMVDLEWSLPAKV